MKQINMIRRQEQQITTNSYHCDQQKQQLNMSHAVERTGMFCPVGFFDL